MAVHPSPTRLASSATFVAEVESAFYPFWGGHCEVVRTFFSQERPQEQLIAWLELQLYKEIHVVPIKAREIIELYERLDLDLDRGEFEAECYELADEVQHYRVLADVLELITGQRRPARDFKPTLEQRDLEAVRQKYANKGELAKSVGGFSPGGGVAFAAAGCMLERGPVQRQLAEAFKVIYRQELEHYNKGRIVFDRRAREADPSEYPVALEYAREVARQHFLMRNAAFGHPLSPERVAQIEAGQVTPYVPPAQY